MIVTSGMSAAPIADPLVVALNDVPLLRRTRYYSPTTGRFNRLDPFAGSSAQPQTLHKYLYTHADPINGIDPTGLAGEFTVIGQAVVQFVQTYWRTIALSAVLVGTASTWLYIKFGLPTNIFKEPYLGYIRDAAAQYNLDPTLLAAIISAEQSDLNLFDIPDGFPASRNSSVGLGQINVQTAIDHDLVGSTDREKVVELLEDPKTNIFATAKYVRIISDRAGPVARALGITSFAGVELDMYALPGDQWDYSNDYTVILLGSEYTSTPWDWIPGSPPSLELYENWGRTVLQHYREIQREGVFK